MVWDAVSIFVTVCKFWFMILLIIRFIPPLMDGIGDFFKGHRVISGIVMVLTIIGFLAFILDVITGRVV